MRVAPGAAPFVLALGILLSTAPTAVPFAQGPTSSAEAIFRIQSNFWINLHHFLRGEARRRASGQAQELPDSLLEPGEQKVWQSALTSYAEHATRSLIFDPTLVSVSNALSMVSDASVPRLAGVDDGTADALQRAATVYRRVKWGEHRDENERWIRSYEASIQKHAPTVLASIAQIFHVTAPTEIVVVDLVRDVGPTLASTTSGPPGTSGHTVLAPQKNVDADVAHDTIFHELSHTMDAEIVASVEVVAARLRVTMPPDWWHALTLYTTTDITWRTLGYDTTADSRRARARQDMFVRNNWQTMLSALEENWQPYLDGRVPYETAMEALVRSLDRSSR